MKDVKMMRTSFVLLPDILKSLQYETLPLMSLQNDNCLSQTLLARGKSGGGDMYNYLRSWVFVLSFSRKEVVRF